jgi:hypothetical protein
MSVDVESNCLGFNFLLDEEEKDQARTMAEFCQPFRGLGSSKSLGLGKNRRADSGVNKADIGALSVTPNSMVTLVLRNAIDSKDLRMQHG